MRLRSKRRTPVAPKSWSAWDYVVYIAIGLSLAVGAVLWAELVPPEKDFSAKWVFFAMNTAVVFGMCALYVKKNRKGMAGWLTLTALLALHLAIGISVTSKFRLIPLVIQAFMIVFELQFVLWLIDKLTPTPAKRENAVS